MSGIEYTSPFGWIRNFGGWGHASGPGRFIIQAMFIGVSTATVLGGLTAMTFAALFDSAALPFIVSSCIGFTMGVTHFYRRSVRRALIDLDKYPAVLKLHLDTHFPFQRYHRRPLGFFTSSNFGRNWVEQSRLVVGWMSSQDNLDALRVKQEMELIEQGGVTDLLSK